MLPGFARSLRRKPSVNHCAKYENRTVDFGDSTNRSRSYSSARSSTFGRRGFTAAVAGRWRPLKVRSVSESHDV